MLFRHLKYILKAKGPDRIHSPFVFDLYYHTLLGNSVPYSAFSTEKQSYFNISEKFIGRNVIKIINKLKPQNIIFLRKENTNNHLYFKEPINTTPTTILTQSEFSDKVSNKKIDLLILESAISENTNLKYENITCLIIYKTNRDQLNNWKKISSLDCYNIVINCFYFGICINRPNQVKEYFRLRF